MYDSHYQIHNVVLFVSSIKQRLIMCKPCPIQLMVQARSRLGRSSNFRTVYFVVPHQASKRFPFQFPALSQRELMKKTYQSILTIILLSRERLIENTSSRTPQPICTDFRTSGIHWLWQSGFSWWMWPRWGYPLSSLWSRSTGLVVLKINHGVMGHDYNHISST